jgi:drug/metabolite transporter (DMT)-like permease
MPYLLLILTALFWSGNFVLARGIHESVPPVALAFWRWTSALAILLPFCLGPLLRQRTLIRQHFRLLSLLALLGVTNFNTFIYLALQSNTVINTVLINSLTPVLIVFISWLAFRQSITGAQAIGVLLSFMGLAWIVSRGHPLALLSVRFAVGDLWTLAAALSWSGYSVLLRKRPAGLDPIGFLGFIVVAGLVFLSPFYLWELAQKGNFAPAPQTLASIAYMALFASVLAFIFWNRAVSAVGANKAGIFVHLMPVFSILLAITCLGERLQKFHLPGIVLVLTGLVLTTTGKLGRGPGGAENLVTSRRRQR